MEPESTYKTNSNGELFSKNIHNKPLDEGQYTVVLYGVECRKRLDETNSYCLVTMRIKEADKLEGFFADCLSFRDERLEDSIKRIGRLLSILDPNGNYSDPQTETKSSNQIFFEYISHLNKLILSHRYTLNITIQRELDTICSPNRLACRIHYDQLISRESQPRLGVSRGAQLRTKLNQYNVDGIVEHFDELANLGLTIEQLGARLHTLAEF